MTTHGKRADQERHSKLTGQTAVQVDSRDEISASSADGPVQSGVWRTGDLRTGELAFLACLWAWPPSQGDVL